MNLFSLFAPLIRNRFPFREEQRPRSLVSPSTDHRTFSRAYMKNEIVFAAIEMLATSAGEPHLVGRRFRRAAPQIRNEIRSEEQRLLARGLPRRDVHDRMIRNGFFVDLPNHPLIRLLDNPNPWMSRGQLWGTVVMDRALAGNAYLLKARFQDGLLKGAVGELWRLRPDRVRIIPSQTNFIEGYEYGTGNDKVTIPPEDVIHFKTRHPLDDYYGMPPLMAIAGRIDIDEYMKQFLKSFFERGGTGPGSILSVKQKLSTDQKEEIRERFRGQFGPQGGYHELMVLDQAESTYTTLGLDRGLRDALPKELDAMQEARIAMVFGIPGSILGLLIGYETSSNANKRQDWQVFWDLTMAPLLSDLSDTIVRQLVPEFGAIDDVVFDLSDIRALQEDVDALVERHLKMLSGGGESWEEFREATGLDPDLKEGTLLIPHLSIPTRVEQLGETPLPPAGERAGEQEAPAIPERVPEARDLLPRTIIAEVHCPQCNRWLGRNINVGATAYCPKCKEVEVRARAAV